MRYTIRKSVVNVLGKIWWPIGANAALTIEMSAYDVENARDDDGNVTRDSLEDWLSTHSGDFSAVTDFHASIEDGDNTIDIPWSSEDNELAYLDCFPSED